jgi:hypothetical protein
MRRKCFSVSSQAEATQRSLPQPDLGTGNPGNCRMKSLQPISAGGTGEAHKANDTRLDRIVAIKVSKTEFTTGSPR